VALSKQPEPPPAPSHFRCDAPGVSIELSLDVVDRMEEEIVAAFRSLDARGSEIGGILLGRPPASGRTVVSIEHYEIVPCDYSHGPLYVLADPDRLRLEAAIRRIPASHPGLSFLGLFRSNTRKDLVPTDADLAILDACATPAHSVFLLIKPFAAKPGVGRFILRRNGPANAGPARLEFPFRRAELMKHPAGRRTAAPIGVEQARRQPALPQRPEECAALARAGTAAPVERPAAAAQPQPAPASAPAARSRHIARTRWLWVAPLVLVLFAAIFVALRRGGTARTTPSDAAPLALRVTRSGVDLVLSWNPAAPAIKKADRAAVAITDGQQRTEISLDRGQLKDGRIVYSPVSGDIDFRLEVTDVARGIALRESVRVLNALQVQQAGSVRSQDSP
jgi:hypothetical protein